MKRIFFMVFIILIIPALCFAQLKKDIQKPNIAKTLESSNNNAFLGLLDPSKFTMRHSVSMSYMTVGNTSLMLNSYMNTMLFQLSDNLLLTTNLGIMNSPYNNMPQNSYLNENHLFGGAELLYAPTENMLFSIRFESTPFYQPSNNMFYSRNPLGFRNYDW